MSSTARPAGGAGGSVGHGAPSGRVPVSNEAEQENPQVRRSLGLGWDWMGWDGHRHRHRAASGPARVEHIGMSIAACVKCRSSRFWALTCACCCTVAAPRDPQAKDALATIDGRLRGTLLGVLSQPSVPLSVEGHAARLIGEATDHENLGKMYICMLLVLTGLLAMFRRLVPGVLRRYIWWQAWL